MTESGQSQVLTDHCSQAYDSMPVAIVVSEAEAKRIVWANRTATELFGYTRDEFTRLTVNTITHPDFRPELPANYAISSSDTGLLTFKRYVRKDGSPFLAELRAAPHPLSSHFVIAVIIDIDQSDRLRIDLAHSAATDTLTGLLRRDAFTAAANAKIETGTPYGLVFVDLDNFKDVNDVYGHQVGDTVLQSVGGRIRDSFRQHDLVCRLGGDEFVIFIDHLDRSIVLRRIINELRTNVESPVTFPFGSLTPLASIGAVLADAGSKLPTAMHEADRAMYRAKQSSRESNRCRHAELVQLSVAEGAQVIAVPSVSTS